MAHHRSVASRQQTPASFHRRCRSVEPEESPPIQAHCTVEGSRNKSQTIQFKATTNCRIHTVVQTVATKLEMLLMEIASIV